MWTVLCFCRNHLSFFKGKGAYAKGHNPFSTQNNNLTTTDYYLLN